MAKLLQGYTNVLTPVNLIPNAKFQRVGGGVLGNQSSQQVTFSGNTDIDTKYLDMNKTFFRYGCFYHPSKISHSALGGGGVRFQGKLIPMSRGVTNYISIRVPIGKKESE